MKLIQTKRLLLSLLMTFSLLNVFAGGGELVIIMEESPISNQYYRFSDIKVQHWTEPDHHSFDFHNTYLGKGYQLISSSNSPFGWCYLAGKGFLPDGAKQNAYYYGKTKKAQEKMKELQSDDYFVTSLAHGKAWEFIVSTKTGFKDQVFKETSLKGIAKWAKPYMDKGYRLTALTPSMTKWFTILTLGTDIDKQKWEQYNNYDEFIAGVESHWKQGFQLQLAEVSPSGKYTAVFSTYSDGRRPRQVVSVASTADEAKQFLNKHYADGLRMVYFGGSYEPGLLCNYDSPTEKANAILGITSGLFTSVNELDSQIASNKQSRKASVNSERSENIPSGLSAAEYQGIYDRYARNAESIVKSLTQVSVNPQTYTGMKKQLRTVQKSMRKTREEARRAGHSIQQTKWETINVTL